MLFESLEFFQQICLIPLKTLTRCWHPVALNGACLENWLSLPKFILLALYWANFEGSLVSSTTLTGNI